MVMWGNIRQNQAFNNKTKCFTIAALLSPSQNNIFMYVPLKTWHDQLLCETHTQFNLET